MNAPPHQGPPRPRNASRSCLAAIILMGLLGLQSLPATSATVANQPPVRSTFTGTLRLKLHKATTDAYGQQQLEKELMFSAKNEVFAFCEVPIKRALRRYALFALWIRGELRSTPDNLMGKCLVVHELEFIQTPDARRIISGFLQVAPPSHHGYTLRLTKAPWLEAMRQQQKRREVGAGATYRFWSLPAALLPAAEPSRRIMVVVADDMERQNYHKLVSYYHYPAAFAGPVAE